MTVVQLRRHLPLERGAGVADPPPPRRTGRWLGLGAGLWVALAAGHLLLSYADARTGQRELERARAALTTAGLEDQRVAEHLEGARRALDRSHRRSSSPLLLPIRALPVAGRQLRSFSALADAGRRAAEIGAATADGIDRVLASPAGTGPERVSHLRRLATLAATAESSLSEIRVADGGGLVSPLARRWAHADEELRTAGARIGSAGRLLDAVASAVSGPRRYLLLVANNAEMRAGSGMFLSVGTIGAVDGTLHLGAMRPAGELTLPGTGEDLEGDLADRWGWLQPGREWRNLATTPRFDVTAPLAARMWQRLTGERVDGVLAVDPELLRAVLTATGPITVGSDVFSASNVVDYVLHDQYDGMSVEDVQVARRDRLGDIAAATLDAVELGNSSLNALGRGVARASQGRHLMAWSADPGEQAAWDIAGISGAMAPSSLAVSVLNRGGNKLDRFLSIAASLETRPRLENTEVTLRLTATNRTPVGESSYVAGPHPDSGVGEGDFLGIVAVNVPAAATDVTVESPAPRLVSVGRDGPTQVVAVPVLIARSGEATVTVRFRLPGTHGSLTVHPSARIPPMTWQRGDERWLDDSRRRVAW